LVLLFAVALARALVLPIAIAGVSTTLRAFFLAFPELSKLLPEDEAD
jgi:hypothetical protein